MGAPGEQQRTFENSCVICMSNQRTHILVPCGHLCLCATCVDMALDRLGSCPLCRGQIQSAMRVYGLAA